MDVAAGMLGDRLAGRLDFGVHAGHPRLDEPAPIVGSHDHAVLLAPVVAKMEAVNRVFQRDVNDAHVVFSDGVKQFIDKIRFQDHVGKQILHAAERPGTFVHGKPDRSETECAVIHSGQGFITGTQPGLVQFWKTISGHVRLWYEQAFNHADILVSAVAVPQDAKVVAKVSGTRRFFNHPAAVVSAGDVIVDFPGEMIILQPGRDPLVRLVREIDIVGHKIRVLVIDGCLDPFALVHVLSPWIAAFDYSR